jgi:hypothetical protein
MRDRNYKNDKAIVLDGGDDAIIADTVAPEPFALTHQRVTQTPRILAARDPFPQISQNTPFGIGAQFPQVADGGAVELDAPDR